MTTINEIIDVDYSEDMEEDEGEGEVITGSCCPCDPSLSPEGYDVTEVVLTNGLIFFAKGTREYIVDRLEERIYADLLIKNQKNDTWTPYSINTMEVVMIGATRQEYPPICGPDGQPLKVPTASSTLN